MVKTVEKEVAIPEGVRVEVKGRDVAVSGPKGSLNMRFSDPMFDSDTTIEKADGKVVVKGGDRRRIKAFTGTIAAHIGNMITGVTKGYRYKLKIFHTHFPITLEVKGKLMIVRNFLGERSVRTADVVGNANVDVKKDDVTVTGISIGDVSQTAANVENACRISGRDRRVFLDGIYITGKEIAND